MDEELLAEFLLESNENLASIEEQLTQLEANPDDEDLLNAIFRVIHTVKGSCGFLGLSGLEKVAHAGENLLGRIRLLKFSVTPDMVALLLECADAITLLLEGLEADGTEPVVDHSDLIERLIAAEQMIQNPETAQSDAGSEPVDKAIADVQIEDWAEGFGEDICQALAAKGFHTPEQVIAAGFAVLRGMDKLDPAAALKLLGHAKAVLAGGGVQKKVKAPPADTEGMSNDSPDTPETDTRDEADVKQAELTSTDEAEKSQPTSLQRKQEQLPRSTSTAGTSAMKPKSAGSIRVNVELLDSLMNQVGELVLTRNRLLQMVQDSGSMDFMRVGREIDHVTERLQAQLLQTRMQPIKSIWNGVPRVVRDMSKQLGKKIRVTMEGEETELDRNILNALKDPLTHIIRNSCDHGVEMPDERSRCGKQEEGRLHLSAAQESGYIVILVEDDGGGIDAEKVKAKAVSMGVLSEQDAAAMSNQQALQLIFNAGLSTAEKVSNLSGRGVGMDVVRTEIEKVGGTVDISSDVGKGTTLRIRIPLTLAIISAMVIGCRERRFAIPQISIHELISAPANSEDWCSIGGQDFFRLRGRLLPVLELAGALGLSEQAQQQGSIVVVDRGERTFGMLVDEIFGAEEIVVKPLGAHFQHLGVYGGCSILGDGSVIPIIDCNGLAQMMSLNDVPEEARPQEQARLSEQHQLQHVLVFEHGDQRYAVPMALVERLEQFERCKIEASGSSEVMQYRDDEVIPVLRWGNLINQHSEPGDEVYGLILSDGRHRMCLQVDEIVDILEVPLEIKKPSQEEFFLGSAVILGQVTEVVDVFDVIKHAGSDWFSGHAAAEENTQKKQVVFVEDAPFFRNLVLPVLDSLNFEVWTAHDGEQACELLQRHTPDLILTDIEMPNMDGYQLAHWVSGQRHLKGVPLVALTATPPDEDDHEHRALFDDVLVKFDRHSLVKHLQRIVDARVSDGKVIHVEAQVVAGEAVQ